jgi:hypothetical protein
MLQTDPEVVRKEVIPTLIRMGREGLQRGTVNQDQFRDFMNQVNSSGNSCTRLTVQGLHEPGKQFRNFMNQV